MLVLLATLIGCGSSFDVSLDFDPDATTAIGDYLEPLNTAFEDAFYVQLDLEGQPMMGVLATTFPDACETYSSYVPVADENYQAMLDLSGGSAEAEVQQAWQAALLQSFPIGSTIFFAAFGVEEASTEAVEGSYTEEWDIASARLGDTQGPQPAGTFVADFFVVAPGIEVYCLYSGLCDEPDNTEATQALFNQWSADAGTLTVDRYASGRAMKGGLDISLVSRWVDTDFGAPAVLGDAEISFDVKPCDTVDERLFRFWSLL